MATNNYLDYAKGSDLVKPIITLLDLEGSQTEGSLFRFMRLEQVDDNRCLLTSYLSEDSWGALYIRSSGIVGESRFLIDGADLKARLNYEPWLSNPLRIKGTKRKQIRLECLLNTNQNRELIDHIESAIYSGNVDDFQVPNNFSWSTTNLCSIPDPFKFRARAAILNTFSKYQNDKNKRFVWFHIEEDTLSVYGSEYSGADAGISLIKVSSPITSPETNGLSFKFGIPAKHLIRILQLVDEHSPLCFRVTEDNNHVQFWSSKGWFVLPSVDPYLSKVLGVLAPSYLNNSMPLANRSDRVYSAQELLNKIAMQRPRQKNDGDGIRLECTDTHLILSKLSDLHRREESYCLFADVTGEETPWHPIILYQTYFMAAVNAALKFCKQFTEEELYESGVAPHTDFNFDTTLEDDYLSLVNETNLANSHLVCLTQGYLENKDMWVVYIDPVPYTPDCSIYLAAGVESNLSDKSEDNI